MALDNLALDIIADDLNTEMKGAFLDKPFALGQYYFAIPYHSGNNKENSGRGTFILSLDPSNPFPCYSLDKFLKVSVNTPFFNSLKQISGTRVKEVKKVRGERIIYLETEITSETLDTINTGYDLILEFFPQKPNAYLLPLPYNKITSLYKEATDVLKDRYMARGLCYLLPPTREPLTKDVKSIEEAKKYLSRSTFNYFEKYSSEVGFTKALDDLLSSKSLYMIDNSIEPFSFNNKDAKKIDTKDLFSHFVTNQKEQARKIALSSTLEALNKVKNTSIKKKKNLEQDLKAAKGKLCFKDYGQELFLHQLDYEKGISYIDVDNYHIPLDPEKDIITNANNYFRKYKKAKAAYQTLGPLIEKTEDEITYIESKILELSKGTNEDILQLKAELSESGLFKEKNSPFNKKKLNKAHSSSPHYLKSDKYKIGFGMNAYQNEELTFKIASKDSIFMHVFNYPGSHVVILYGDSKETRLLAGELALYLSNLEEGDVSISPINKVKKNKEHRGLVNLLEYKLMTIRNIRPESKKLFEDELKIS